MKMGVTSLTDIRPYVTKTVLQKCENTLVNFFFHKLILSLGLHM
jgi:hypothetical protein